MKSTSMMRRFRIAALLSVGVWSPALAAHNEPRTASKVKGEFVTAYERCASPNATTSNGFPACKSPVRSDPGCGFTTKGKGKFQVKYPGSGADHVFGTSDDGDFAVRATLTKLDAGCIGATLTLALSLHVTLDGCTGEACTVATLLGSAVGNCVVDVIGGCRINATATALPPGTASGMNAGIELVGIDMLRGTARTFAAGALVH